MKKTFYIFLTFLLVFTLAACGNDDSSKSNSSDDNSQKSETSSDVSTVEPTEPDEHTKCAGCDMKVYMKDEEMGVFTAQAVTEDGEHLFFDDSGCLLNAPRKTGEEYATTWVRDYYTKEWIKTDDSLAVHSDIATPMKMGNAFFSNQEEVDQFLEEKADLNPEVVTWDDIDAVAYERYKKKMEQQNKNSEDSSEDSSDM